MEASGLKQGKGEIHTSIMALGRSHRRKSTDLSKRSWIFVAVGLLLGQVLVVVATGSATGGVVWSSCFFILLLLRFY